VLFRCPSTQTRFYTGILLCLAGAKAFANESPSQSPDNLGTLFYSSSERAAVQKARLGEVDAPSANALFSVDGVVKRAGGKSTVWINGRAIPEGQSPFPTPLRFAINAGAITVKGTRVRIGETVNLDNLQRTDFIAPGSLISRVTK
jgi:hypothetical protein